MIKVFFPQLPYFLGDNDSDDDDDDDDDGDDDDFSYDFISLNFKTRPKITSLVCLVFAARQECIRP